LGWGKSITYLSEKEKKMKKCRLPWIYTHKKNRKKKIKKSKAKNIKKIGLIKKFIYV